MANSPTEKKLNILTFPTHERYENQLCKTEQNFYAFQNDNTKTWNKNYADIPENYLLMPKDSILDYVKFDLILAQERFMQFHLAKRIQQHLGVPILCLEHTVPMPHLMNPEVLTSMKNCVGDVNVFISDFSQKQWGINHNSVCIEHSIDSNKFSNKNLERHNTVLSVANDFINRDYCLNFSGWQKITEDIEHTLVGDNPGMSEAAKSVEELVEYYNTHSVFLNTSTYSPIPTSLLEAMSCGCAVVSTATCMIPEIIEDGVNGFISNDEEVLKDKVKYLLEKPDKAREMGNKARETIKTRFSEDRFIQEWNTLFTRARNLT